MTKRRKQNLFTYVLTAFLFVSGCSKVLNEPDPEAACAFVQNKASQRVSWKSRLPVKFRVHKDVPISAHASIKKAVDNWNSISTQKVIEVVDWSASGTPATGYSDGNPTMYWSSTWEADRASEQARTTIVWSGESIRDADIKFNAKNFDFSHFGEELSKKKVDFVSLAVHEIGHALGFAHSEDRKSVMFPLLSKGTDRRDVNILSDLESYTCEYGNEIVQPQVFAAAQVGQEEVVQQADPQEEDASNPEHQHDHGVEVVVEAEQGEGPLEGVLENQELSVTSNDASQHFEEEDSSSSGRL